MKKVLREMERLPQMKNRERKIKKPLPETKPLPGTRRIQKIPPWLSREFRGTYLAGHRPGKAGQENSWQDRYPRRTVCGGGDVQPPLQTVASTLASCTDVRMYPHPCGQLCRGYRWVHPAGYEYGKRLGDGLTRLGEEHCVQAG